MDRLRRAIATTLLSALVAACGSTASPSATTSPGTSATPVQPTAVASVVPAPPVASSAPVSPSPATTVAPSAVPDETTATGALTGALPVALRGTWQLQGETGYWVFGTNRAYTYHNEDPEAHTLLGVGTSGDEISFGPRLDDPGLCQKIGLYRWTVVPAKELRITPIGTDPCPRAVSLAHAVFRYVSAATDRVDPPATGLPAACPLVTSGEIATLRGMSAGLADPSESSPNVADCIWTVSDTNASVVLDVTVQRFDPALWESQSDGASRPTHGPGWVGAISSGNQSLMTVRANGYLISLGLPASPGISATALARQETSVADLVVSRLAPIR